MSTDKAAGPGLKPLVRIVAFSGAGADLSMMGTDPIPATRKFLEEAGWTVSDLDPVEANEAFAAQTMAVNKERGWDTARVDISGGAISIGHPIGDPDARGPVTLLHGMQCEHTLKGLATLCSGGGQGVAMAVESVD